MNASLIGRGALLLAAGHPETKKGREELLGLIKAWLSESSNGKPALPSYQREALLFLNKELREKKKQLVIVVDVEGE